MVVILSKEEERADMGLNPLDYNLSEIKNIHRHRKRKNLDFKLDESDD
jgi:hypothetical protein